MLDALTLAQNLIRIDTTNPPGREASCAEWLGARLTDIGFDVKYKSFAVGRSNLVARLNGRSDQPPLVLTGHLDTVPLGTAAWAMDPFAAEIAGGRLYGRGASDMKSGVAAICAAAGAFAFRSLGRGVWLVLTGGEETGCSGARAFTERELGPASGMVVGEPTSNRIATAHKGCLAVRATTRGVTAHSSMPDLGVNAIYSAAAAIGRIENSPSVENRHSLLGKATRNVGMIRGGMNYNSVPDAAEFTVDVRTVPGMDHSAVEAELRAELGDAVALERFVDIPPMETSADDAFVAAVQAATEKVLGETAGLALHGLPFFSDASVLKPMLRCPTVILGPGEPSLAHQTDEWCEIDNIRAATAIYSELIADWCS